MLMTMRMSRWVMTDVEYPWGSLGKVGPPREDISMVAAQLEDMQSALMAEIVDLKDRVRQLREDFLQFQRSSVEGFDERSVTSFMNLDDLGVAEDERPEVIPLSEDPDVTVIKDSFTAPPPVKGKVGKRKKAKKVKKPVLPNPYEGLEEGSVAGGIYLDILQYIETKGPVMNNNLKRTGIVPEGAVMNKKVKELLKVRVAGDDSGIRYHKLDRMRGFYYGAWDDRDPVEIYDQDISKSN